MARRAVGALTAMLACAVLAVPTALLTAAPSAAAATSGVPATVAFTGMNPQWASPATTITVTGSVKNTSGVTRRLAVQLFGYSAPVNSVAELQQSAAEDSANGRSPVPLPNTTWQSPLLRPGAAASWSFRVPVSTMGLTSFGVYLLNAQVSDLEGQALNQTLTYLPYVPAKAGVYGSSIPAAQKISWVWPLIDQPLLREPWRNSCTGQQAAALAQSLTSSGRLGQLVDAAGTSAGTAAIQAQTAHTGGGAAQRLATVTDPGQGLAQQDAVTWAVDPALLVNVSDLSQCGASEPQWARTASAWLGRLKQTTASQPMFVTPYGDPNVTALIGAKHASDIEMAFTIGRNRASRILGARDLTPSATSSDPTDPAAVAWSTGGLTTYTAAELTGPNRVGTLLAGSSAFPLSQSSVVRALNPIGGYVNVLLANDSLTGLLGSAAGTGPGSAFMTAQQFLAETALLAKQHPSTPIIVAPPQRWQPPGGLASALLAETASAPWLSPATLTSLTAATHIPTVQLPTGAPGLGSLEQGQLSALNTAVDRQLALRGEQEDQNLSLAVSTVESSAYSDRFKETALGMVDALTVQMATQEKKVHIIAENRITLGGTRGSVPVSIDNHLPYPVRVTLQLSYSQADGVRVSAPGPRTVPAHTAQTVRLRITATQPGSTTITMTLLNHDSQPLASPQVRTTVQTTKVGLLGVIIFGAALGVFLLASAARAIRRGKPRQTPDEPDYQAPREDDQPGHSTGEAGPDTVVTGPTGAAPPWTSGSAGMHKAR